MARALIVPLIALAALATGCGRDPQSVLESSNSTSRALLEGGTGTGDLVIVPEGSYLTVRLVKELSSAHARVGDTLTATVLDSVIVRGKLAVPTGSVVTGTVVGLTRPTPKNPRTKLSVDFNRLDLLDGFSTSILTRRYERISQSVFPGTAAGGNEKYVGPESLGPVGSPSEEGQVDLPPGTHLTLRLDGPVAVPAQG